MNNTIQETPSATLLGTVTTIAVQHGVIGGNTNSTPIPPAQTGTSTSLAMITTTTSPGIHVSSATPTSTTVNKNSPLSKRDTLETNHERKSIAAGAPTLTKAETVFCGSTAGVVSRFVIAPLDVVKIRLQVQTQRKDLASILRRKSGQDTAYDVRTRTAQQPKYRGMFSGMATIAREEGIRGLWKGNMAAEYLYLTYGGMQFLVYQQTKAFLSAAADNSRQRYPNNTRSSFVSTVISSSSAQSFVSGATAGIMATACTYPFDLLRTRFAVQREVKVYTGVLQAFRHIYLKDGVKGYYKGMSPALIQVIPYMGIMFGSYDTLKQLASWLKTRAANDASISSSSPDQKPLSRVLLGLEDMFCGAMSGVISKTGVYPLDMVRKRLQIQGSDQQKANASILSPQPVRSLPGPGSGSGSVIARTAASISTEVMPTTVWKTMVHIVRQEGYLALYKGLLPGVLKAAPASAVTFLIFSQTGALLERIRRPAHV